MYYLNYLDEKRTNGPIMQVLLLKGCYTAVKNAGLLGLRKRGIQSRASDKA